MNKKPKSKMDRSSNSLKSDSSYRQPSCDDSDPSDNEVANSDDDNSENLTNDDDLRNESLVTNDQSYGSVELTPSPKTTPSTARRNVQASQVSDFESSKSEGRAVRRHTQASSPLSDLETSKNKGKRGCVSENQPSPLGGKDPIKGRQGIHDDRKSPKSNTDQFQKNVTRTVQSTSNLIQETVNRRSSITKQLHEIPRERQVIQNSPVEFPISIQIVCVLSLIVVVVFGYARFKSDDSQNLPIIKTNEILADFLQAFDQLNVSFPAQTPAFWKVLRSGTRSIMGEQNPVQPAAFIVSVPTEAEPTALCIIQKYAKIVTEAFNASPPIEFSHHLRVADTPERIKHLIDDKLNDGFRLGSRVAIVHELNKLHGKSAMMFHGYCDNENAPFTRAAFVFLLHLNNVDEETDEAVEKKLSQIWGRDLDNDTLFPLLSRIGNRNIFVRRESREVLEMNGCA